MIVLAGELNSCTALVVTKAIEAVLERRRSPHAIVLDLAEVTFLSFAGVQVLHSGVDLAAADRVTLRIALGSHAIVQRALTATGMAAVLDVYPGRRTALDAPATGDFLPVAWPL
ncbi:STAS domain-containing protein [Amycolatopsis sp. lyj-84]|uniref:STAS domain-containing protein n=1 Tax=Amycolatopsis sp. lyj-84 TaxID=2789284 RepID=UPI00397DBD4D